MASIDPSVKAAAAMAAAAAAAAAVACSTASSSLSSSNSSSVVGCDRSSSSRNGGSSSSSSSHPKSLPEFLFGSSGSSSSRAAAAAAAAAALSSVSKSGSVMDFSPEAYPFNLLQLQQQQQQAQQHHQHLLQQQQAAHLQVQLQQHHHAAVVQQQQQQQQQAAAAAQQQQSGSSGGGKAKGPKKSRAGGRSFMCYICQHEFDHVSTLLVHMSTSHFHDQIWSKYESTYFPHNFALCVVCNRDFKSGKTKTNCVGHIGGKHRKVFEFMPENESNALQYHTTRKPYNVYTRQVNKDDLVCMYCNKQLSTLTVLKQHIISSHLYSKMNKEYGHVNTKCPFCEKTFSNHHDKGGIMMHIGAKHNKILDFVPHEIALQLQRLNVKDEMESRASVPTSRNNEDASSSLINSSQHQQLESNPLSAYNMKTPDNMNPFLGLISSSWQHM